VSFEPSFYHSLISFYLKGTWGNALTKHVHDTSRACDLSLYNIHEFLYGSHTWILPILSNIFFPMDECNNMLRENWLYPAGTSEYLKCYKIFRMLSSSLYSLFYTLLNRCLLPLLRVVYGLLYSPYWWGSCIYTHTKDQWKMKLFATTHVSFSLCSYSNIYDQTILSCEQNRVLLLHGNS